MPVLVKIAETVGPILLRELSKRRTQEFIRDTIVDLTTGRKLPTGKKQRPRGKKFNKFIIRRGTKSYQCSEMR